jgi:hypothetical protein
LNGSDRTKARQNSAIMGGGGQMALVALASGVVCSAALAAGLGLIVPVGGMIGGFCDLVAVASGMVLLGLVDSA